MNSASARVTLKPLARNASVAGVGALLGLHPADGQDHLVRLAREQVAAAGAAVGQQADPGRQPALDLGAIRGRRAGHHRRGLLLDPAEGGDVLVRAQQDPRLAGTGLRREVGLPFGERVAVLGDPAGHVRGAAVAHRAAQDRQAEAVDLEEDDPRGVGAGFAALAAGDPLHHPERVLVVVVGPGQHLDHDRGGRHHQRGEQRVAERADREEVREDLVGEHQRARVGEQDQQEAGDQGERQPQGRDQRRQDGVDDRDRGRDQEGAAGLLDRHPGDERRRDVDRPRRDRPTRRRGAPGAGAAWWAPRRARSRMPPRSSAPPALASHPQHRTCSPRRRIIHLV